jgi:hypothetical protein
MISFSLAEGERGFEKPSGTITCWCTPVYRYICFFVTTFITPSAGIGTVMIFFYF